MKGSGYTDPKVNIVSGSIAGNSRICSWLYRSRFKNSNKVKQFFTSPVSYTQASFVFAVLLCFWDGLRRSNRDVANCKESLQVARK